MPSSRLFEIVYLLLQRRRMTAAELAERFEIATRPGAHCAPRLHRALGTEDQGAVRFSWSYFNTEAETDAAAEAVRILAAEAV